ncbi:MAG: hypothetical protein GTN88_07340, partial [Gammaproteobacteria bacterium]|nr:hypothetical protein [Gammaproteobacteria bacterium]NIQ26335.1 hypothetical protein [Gammaproteobacteria bacterium]NIT93875.1 hypothetical protein [Gammaproteobacteria bacterium]
LILLSLLVSVLLWSNLDNRFVWIVIGITAGYGLLGFIDDYRKVKQGHSAGISARPSSSGRRCWLSVSHSRS